MDSKLNSTRLLNENFHYRVGEMFSGKEICQIPFQDQHGGSLLSLTIVLGDCCPFLIPQVRKCMWSTYRHTGKAYTQKNKNKKILSVYVCKTEYRYLRQHQRHQIPLQLELQGGSFELPSGCWDLNSHPLQEHYVP